jgi:hypothetical protein
MVFPDIGADGKARASNAGQSTFTEAQLDALEKRGYLDSGSARRPRR